MKEPLSMHELYILKIINLTFSCLSFLGYSFSYFIYWFFKDVRTFVIEQVIWLLVSCTFYSFAGFLWNDDLTNISSSYGAVCDIQSFLQIMFQMSIIIWTCILGYLANIKILRKSFFDYFQNRLRIIFLCLGFALPLTITIIFSVLKVSGPSGGSCWMDIYTPNSDKLTLVRKISLIYYAFLWILLIMNIYFVTNLYTASKNNDNLENIEYIKITVNRMKLYPIIISVCLIASSTNRIVYFVTKIELKFLVFFQTVMNSIQGLLICIVFNSHPTNLSALKLIWNKCRNKKRRNSEKSSLISSENEKKNDDVNLFWALI